MTDDMQKHVAAWELLAQFVLTFCISHRLPVSHEPVTCHQGTDDSATDASHHGLSMTPAMADILCQYFIFISRSNVFADMTHIPGYQIQLADALSRFEDPPQPDPSLSCRSTGEAWCVVTQQAPRKEDGAVTQQVPKKEDGQRPDKIPCSLPLESKTSQKMSSPVSPRTQNRI